MLAKQNIENLITRTHISEFNLDNFTSDKTGDLIQAFDPDTKIYTVKRYIANDKILRNKVTDMGLLYIDLEDIVWIDGNKVTVAITFECGTGGFGTRIKMMVKHIDVVVGSEMKSFLSFEAYNSYLATVNERG